MTVMAEKRRQRPSPTPPASFRLQRTGVDALLHDPLTGLERSEALHHRGPKLLRRADRHAETCVVAVMDVDNLKDINDAGGHAVGDAVLAEVADRLQATLPRRAVLVRRGGDEFACLLHEGFADVDQLMRRILDVVAEPIVVSDLTLETSLSIGVASTDRIVGDIDQLLWAADQAMYAAKQEGPGRWRDSSPIGLAPREQLDIREAIDSSRFTEEIRVDYQPQVVCTDDLSTSPVHGFEALVRWEHPEIGTLGPAQFIPAVQRAGKMPQLTAAVIRTSVEDLGRLSRAVPSPRLSINVTRRDLISSALARGLAEHLRTQGLSADRVMLEVPEPAGRASLLLGSELRALTDQGLGLSLRGFGTSDSSLRLLWGPQLISELKLDAHLFATDDEDHRLGRRVAAITAAARELGVRVVAQGVEDPQTAAAAAAAGCSAVQGFAVAEPMSIHRVVGWAEARSPR